MPTYQYACTACEHRFEVVQSFSDASLTECPVCEGRLRKLFSGVGIVFKGSGFYRTDSRATATAGDAPKEKAAAGAGKDGGKESGSASTSSGDSGSTSSGATASAGASSSSTTSKSSSSSTAASSAA